MPAQVIVQKYIERPLLYKRRKFDIRCLVMVDPLMQAIIIFIFIIIYVRLVIIRCLVMVDPLMQAIIIVYFNYIIIIIIIIIIYVRLVIIRCLVMVDPLVQAIDYNVFNIYLLLLLLFIILCEVSYHPLPRHGRPPHADDRL